VQLDPVPFRLLLQSLILAVIIALAVGASVASQLFQQRLVRLMALFWTLAALVGVSALVGLIAVDVGSWLLLKVSTVGYFMALFAAASVLPAAFREVQEQPVAWAIIGRRILWSVPMALIASVLSWSAPRNADSRQLGALVFPVVSLIVVTSASAVAFFLGGRRQRTNRDVYGYLVLGMVLLASRPLQQVVLSSGSWQGYPGPNATLQFLSLASALLTMLAVAYTQVAAAVAMERVVIDARAARLRAAENAAARRRRHETAGYLANGISRNVEDLLRAIDASRTEIATRVGMGAELAILDTVQDKGRTLLDALRTPDDLLIDGHKLEIGTLVEVALPRVQRMLPNRDIRWTPSSRHHHSDCPPEEFSRAVMNLILFMNAGAAVEEHVDVSLSAERLVVSQGLLSAGDYARLRVRGRPQQDGLVDAGDLGDPFAVVPPLGTAEHRNTGLTALRRFTRLLGGDARAERDQAGRLTVDLFFPDDESAEAVFVSTPPRAQR
jgi:hypothetical protein